MIIRPTQIMRTTPFILLFLFSSLVYGQTKYQKDFDYYWTTINDNFAYFDTQKTNWKKVRDIYQPRVDTITTTRSFVRLLENINNELFNGHISLNANLPSSNRLIPTGADLWVKYQENQFIIAALREGYGAERSGLKPGMKITHYNGVAIDSAVQDFLPKSVSVHDERMYEYAVNMLLAGRHNTTRSISTKSNGVEKVFYPDSPANKNNPGNTKILDYK